MRQFNQEELVEKIRSERRHMNELYDEISQLKQENANLKNYVKSLKDECISCPDNKKNIKQAQINVLNKIKNCREATDSDCYPYLERIVNKLIEEVENDNSKSNKRKRRQPVAQTRFGIWQRI